jgi:hypothetical protein
MMNVNGNDVVRPPAQHGPENGYPRGMSAANAQKVHEERIARARILWEHRRTLAWSLVWGFVASLLLVLTLPKGYEATAKLMPPETGSGNGAALMAALATRGAGMLGGLAGDLLGVKGNGPVFVEILESRTVADRLIDEFQLSQEYRTTKIEYTRKQLEAHTKISEDRKSGVITITVTSRDPGRAAPIAQAYMEELVRLVS